MHKLFVTGFDETIAPVHDAREALRAAGVRRARAHGLGVDGFNDRASGTLHFDINDEYALQKTRRLVGGALTRYLVQAAAPWNGRVPTRLDWFAGRGVDARPRASTVDPRPLASDHAAIVVDLRL